MNSEKENMAASRHVVTFAQPCSRISFEMGPNRGDNLKGKLSPVVTFGAQVVTKWPLEGQISGAIEEFDTPNFHFFTPKRHFFISISNFGRVTTGDN